MVGYTICIYRDKMGYIIPTAPQTEEYAIPVYAGLSRPISSSALKTGISILYLKSPKKSRIISLYRSKISLYS